MGKGTIVSHIGNGEYSVTVKYNRGSIDAAIAVLEARDSMLVEQILNELDESKRKMLRLLLESVRKRLRYLENTSNVPKDKTITAWCADYSEDLSGDVGLIEIGREQALGVNIQPGYNGNAAYDSARDGQFTPLMGQTPEATFYNLAMLPGFQKWKPTYLYGSITSIDYESDTCSVSLESPSSSQQLLSITQEPSLSDVSVKYMQCNSRAFEDGDEVLIYFENYDFDSPKVIGFKKEPVKCCWEEPWDGPGLTSMWPWIHAAAGQIYPSLAFIAFPNTTTVTITAGVADFIVPTAPIDERWITQIHQWYYWPTEESTAPLMEEATSVVISAEVVSYPGSAWTSAEYFFDIMGEKDGATVAFRLRLLSTINPRHGYNGFMDGTEWEDKGTYWSKDIEMNSLDVIELPVEGVQINYIIIQMQFLLVGGEDDLPEDYRPEGGEMTIDYLAIC